MQEGKERTEIAASQIRQMIEKQKQEHEAGAEPQRAVGFFKNCRKFFEDVRSGFVDLNHCKLLNPSETGSPPRWWRGPETGS